MNSKGEGAACDECTVNKSEAWQNADNDGHAPEKTLTRDDRSSKRAQVTCRQTGRDSRTETSPTRVPRMGRIETAVNENVPSMREINEELKRKQRPSTRPEDNSPQEPRWKDTIRIKLYYFYFKHYQHYINRLPTP